MAIVLEPSTIADEINEIPFEEPKKKWSQIVREWPDEWWCINAIACASDGIEKRCTVGIIMKVSGMNAIEVGKTLQIHRSGTPSAYGYLAKINDDLGKIAAADLLESWGLLWP